MIPPTYIAHKSQEWNGLVVLEICSHLISYLREPAIGIPRNRHSSQNPAKRDTPAAATDGNHCAAVFGSTRGEDGVHHPKPRTIIK